MVSFSSRVVRPGVGQAAGGGVDLVSGGDLDAEVAHAGVLPRLALEEDELERGFGDGEVGVAVAEFRGLGVEQSAVEGARCLEVGDAQSELHEGHDAPPAGWIGGSGQPQQPPAGVFSVAVATLAGAASWMS
ncbi:hypothetical protein GCM10010261_62150 [Streptomyces pilosus]|nr:hypothetical protein GCM10010261_62150 [Streptomyces pilosus]